MNEQVFMNYELDLDPKSIWITAAPAPDIKASFVYLQECGNFYSLAKHYTRRKSGLKSYLIECTLSGEGLLEYEGNQYPLRPGSLFWIDCRLPHYYRTNPEVGIWHTLWVHFYGANSADYYKQFLSFNSGSYVADPASNIHITSLIQEPIHISSKQERNAVDDIYVSGLLTLLMSECLKSLAPRNVGEGMPESVRDAMDYLMKNYTTDISLDDLAHRYNINKYYFQKLFKRYTNYTPNQYLIQTRLNMARELLRTTSRPVSEISCDVGIGSVNHFINLFKRQEGMTPNTFRKMWFNNQK